jgi:predicted CXXCH cytochrome family protein
MMKIIRLRFLLSATLPVLVISALFAGLTFGAGVIGTLHDLTSKSWWPGPGVSACSGCHVPSSSVVGTLPILPQLTSNRWNHQLSTANYTLYASPTLMATVGQPDLGSKFCLGCHDGTVALENFNGVTTGTNYISVANNLGTDLRNSHPTSFKYDSALVAANPWLANPATQSYAGVTIAAKLLSNGTMTCSTCHDSHNNQNGYFLVQSNAGSALCSSCHLKNVAFSKHDFSNPGISAYKSNSPVNTAPCGICHSPHFAIPGQPALGSHVPSTTSPLGWQMYASSTLKAVMPTYPDANSMLCLNCHDGTAPVVADRPTNRITGINNLGTDLRNSHPVSFNFNNTITNSTILKPGLSIFSTYSGTNITIGSRLTNGIMTCSTCHEIHSNSSAPALIAHNINSSLCLSCHDRVNSPLAHQMSTLTITISGAGSVTSNDATGTNYTCSKTSGGTCTPVPYGIYDTVTLTPIGSNSSFTSWSGDIIGNANPYINLSMNSNKNVTATFTADPARVSIVGNPTVYYSLAAALAVPTKDEEIRVKETPDFLETITSTNIHNLKLRGGFTTLDFSDVNRTGFSTISGWLKIQGGKLTVERLKIK